MNAPHYSGMDTVWDDQSLAPQLELEEYGSPDPTATYGLPQGSMNPSAAGRQPLPPSGHSSSFGGYNAGFPQNTSFNFTVQPPQQQQNMNGSQQALFQTAGPSGATTPGRGFSPQGMYAGPSSMHASPNMNQSAYLHGSPYSSFTPSGPSHGQFEHEPAYSSPPMGFPASYQGQQQPSPYMSTELGAGEPYGAPPAAKRLRPEDAVYYEEHSAEEKDGGASKADQASKRP